MADKQLFSREQAQRRIEFIGVLADKFDEIAGFGRFQNARFITLPEEDLKWCVRRGCMPVYALDVLLHNLLEAALTGHLAFSCQGLRCTSGETSQMLSTIFDQLYATILAYLNAAGELQPERRKEEAIITAFVVLENLPRLQIKAEWNIFASLRDPAVWDQHSRKLVNQADELPKLDLQPEIDRSIRERDTGHFKNKLSQHGLLEAYGYRYLYGTRQNLSE